MDTLAALDKNESWLSWFLKGILVLGFVILLARLIELQIIKGNYYKNLANSNRIRRIRLTAPRGKVYARGGEVLIGNKETKKKLVFKSDGTIEKADTVDITDDDVVISEYIRDYSLGESFFHAGGYVAQASEDEVGKVNPRCLEKGPLKLGTLIGRGGLEQEYECLLSGQDGEELIEVDTKGKKIRVLGKKEPIPGKDLKTSISYELQEKMPDFMEGKKGAVVVSDPQGEIISLYSSPSFDPNYFGKKEYSSYVGNALKDPNLPLFDRAIGGLFHPGSVFKPVVAISALEEGKINKDFTYDDPGVIKVNDFSYANWYFTQYGGKEGKINLVRALTRSTDTFFYNLGELTGPEKISDWAQKFGLGSLTGIDIPGEIEGLIPNPIWKERVKKERWFLGNTYHFSIGQGDLALTPVEVHSMMVSLANGGKLCSLKIVKDGLGKETCKNLKIAKTNIDLIKEGMTGACSVGGTGYTFFDFKPQVACKTGTAETNTDGKTHAWFTVYGPNDFPDIVATVLLEGGGEGSKVAGPIARKIFDWWFLKKEDIKI